MFGKPRIAPGIKGFLQTALPAGGRTHALTTGELHGQAANYQFLRAHLDELAKDHSVGTIGFEQDTFMNVFSWAYRDGKLPVAKQFAASYMRMIVLGYEGEKFRQGGAVFPAADLMMAAVDRNLMAVSFDSRNTFDVYPTTTKIPAALLKREFESNPAFRDECRRNPKALDGWAVAVSKQQIENGMSVEEIRGMFRLAFTVLEAKTLLNENPEYQDRLNKIEAFIKVGRREGIGRDALSAAILANMAAPDKNIVSISGIGHITGIKTAAQKLDMHGTFAEHLSMFCPVTRAFLASEKEMKADVLPYYTRNDPMDFPATLLTDKGQIMNEGAIFRLQLSDAHRETARKMHQKSLQPGTAVSQTQYVGRMQKALASPKMTSFLARLRPVDSSPVAGQRA